MKKDLFDKNLDTARHGIGRLLLVCVILYFIIKILLEKLVGIPNENSTYASIFICVGIFFVLLDIMDRISTKAIKKQSIKTYGEIVKCERVIKRDNKGVIAADYYLIDYAINYNGEEIIAQRIGENKRKIGKVENIYFNPNNKTIFLIDEVDGTEDKGILYVFAVIFFLIAVPIIVFPLMGGIVADSNFWLMIFSFIVGIGAVIAGIMMFKSVFKDLNKEKYYEKIEAIVIDNEEGSYYDNDDKKTMVQTFYPTYEYTYNGIKRTYQSKKNGFLEVGSKEFIMVSKKTGEVHIKSKKAGLVFGAIFCIIVGILAVLSVIISIMTQ